MVQDQDESDTGSLCEEVEFQDVRNKNLVKKCPCFVPKAMQKLHNISKIIYPMSVFAFAIDI